MDELLGGFLAETFEYLEGVETQILQFERNPSEAALVSSIFRLVHTIKGTSSFLGLDRLCAVAHAAESLLGDLRDGAPPTPDSVSAILAALDRIKRILRDIEALGAEPSGVFECAAFIAKAIARAFTAARSFACARLCLQLRRPG
jgi:two-component system chemotaxis sensor kinase CheA